MKQIMHRYVKLSRIRSIMDHKSALRMLQNGPSRGVDLIRAGLSKATLSRWVGQGRIKRLARGVYGLDEQIPDPHHQVLVVQKQTPKSVVCLLSALQVHGLTTQIPREVWLALEGRAHRPVLEGFKVRIFRFTGTAFHEGIEVHKVAGGKIRVYGVAKTVVDCFRLRNKIGMDVAIEALRDALRSRKTTFQDLESVAGRTRILSVMRPYLVMEAAS